MADVMKHKEEKRGPSDNILLGELKINYILESLNKQKV